MYLQRSTGWCEIRVAPDASLTFHEIPDDQARRIAQKCKARAVVRSEEYLADELIP